MIDPQVETLRTLLHRLEEKQDIQSERGEIIQLLRGLVEAFSSATAPGSTRDAASGVISSDPETQALPHALERRVAELEALRQVSMNLTASLDLRQVLRSVLEEVLRLINNVTDTHIFLYENGQVSFGSALFSDGQSGRPFTEPRPNGLTYSVARQGQSISVANMADHPLFTDTNWVGSIIGIPLKIGRRVVGVMTVCRQPAEEFQPDDTRLLQLLADHAAIAIENARLHGLLEEQAHRDPLTGLHNRRSLDERLENEALRYQAVRQNQSSVGRIRSFALLMIDLDGFKAINDRYGHLAGDYVLREISQSILMALRKTDFLARFGGDELALLLSEIDLEVASQVAKRAQDYVSRTQISLPNFDPKSLSVCIGGALFPEHAGSIRELVEAADAALYEAKHSSSGSIVFAKHAASPEV